MNFDVKKIVKAVLPVAGLAISLITNYYNEKELVDETTKKVLKSLEDKAKES